jgi:hypothetical protein
MIRNRKASLVYRGLTLVVIAALSILAAGCSRARVNTIRATGPIETPSAFSHSALDSILKVFVADGLVDYQGLKASDALTPYLESLAGTDPASLPENERLAFWINAYNALTLKLITDNYPTESILHLSPLGIKGLPFIVPKVNTPFKLDVGEVGGRIRTLDEIEHDIIRKQFEEPRIHFALVCAARSCPPLRSEAYAGDRLDEQLDDQAQLFLNDADKNRVDSEKGVLALSKIFKWFADDFGGTDTALQQCLAPYFAGETKQKLTQGDFAIRYLGYNWDLNDRAGGKPDLP